MLEILAMRLLANDVFFCKITKRLSHLFFQFSTTKAELKPLKKFGGDAWETFCRHQRRRFSAKNFILLTAHKIQSCVRTPDFYGTCFVRVFLIALKQLSDGMFLITLSMQLQIRVLRIVYRQAQYRNFNI